ncbi:MAG: LCP family protein [Eubacteriaceae bacterium]|jgi:LCP family protein required for cell wall assembly|nr:LCP family protein [Eubacteriaceae bacterium]
MDGVKNARMYLLAVSLFFAEALFAVILLGKLYLILGTASFAAACFAALLALGAHFLAIASKKAKAMYMLLASSFASITAIAAAALALAAFSTFGSTLKIMAQSSWGLYSSAKGMQISPGIRVGYKGDIDSAQTMLALSEIRGLAGGDIEAAEYSTMSSLALAMASNSIDAALIKGTYLSFAQVELKTYKCKAHEIHECKLTAGYSPEMLEDLAKTPFCLYASGIDESEMLSDANLIITVNPLVNEILITNVPRDYYVFLNGDEGKPDKLTHCAAYGIECSLATIESLLGIKIDYYAQANFQAFVSIVDALGGINATAETDFTSIWSLSRNVEYEFKKGENHLDGKAALAFARERKQFASGDRMRSVNQQAVLTGMIEKLQSPAGLLNAYSILEAIAANAKTNIKPEQIVSLVINQLENSPKWSLCTFRIDGEDSFAKCYSAEGLSYVTLPDESIIQEARDMILALLKRDE